MPIEKLKFSLANIAASLFILLLIISAFVLCKIYLRRKNKFILDQERLHMQFEKTLLESTLAIQTETFANIGREIHDNIGQILSLARINLSQAKLQGETDKVAQVDELLAKVIVDIRTISYSLDSNLIWNQGWLEPFTKLLQDLEKAGKFTTTLDVDDDLPMLEKDKSIILFRILQEIINNIINYADANNIHVVIKSDKDDLLINVKDNGKVVHMVDVSAGSGLSNLEKRLKLIDSRLAINSIAGNGTSVTILVKREKNE